jgi:Bacterial dnaA protein helix-turn-helix
MDQLVHNLSSEPEWFTPTGSATTPQPDTVLNDLLAQLENLFASRQNRSRLETPGPQRPIINPDVIIDHVVRHLRVEREQVLGSSRVQHVSFVRQVCMYLCREITGSSWHVLGRCFGRDHATVLYGVNVIRRRMSDPAFAKLITRVEQEITATVPAPAEVAA